MLIVLVEHEVPCVQAQRLLVGLEGPPRPGRATLGAMEPDWCGLLVRTRALLRFGIAVGVFTEGPHAGRLRVRGPYRVGSGTQAEWQGTLVYLSPERRYGAAGGEAYSCRWRRWRRALRGSRASCHGTRADQAVPHGTARPSAISRQRAALARRRGSCALAWCYSKATNVS
jgi:hypothetical protein